MCSLWCQAVKMIKSASQNTPLLWLAALSLSLATRLILLLALRKSADGKARAAPKEDFGAAPGCSWLGCVNEPPCSASLRHPNLPRSTKRPGNQRGGFDS